MTSSVEQLAVFDVSIVKLRRGRVIAMSLCRRGAPLDGKADVDHVALFDLVVLAFDAQEAL